MKWVAIAYIIAVLVISAKAKAVRGDEIVDSVQVSELDSVFEDQAKFSE